MAKQRLDKEMIGYKVAAVAIILFLIFILVDSAPFTSTTTSTTTTIPETTTTTTTRPVSLSFTSAECDENIIRAYVKNLGTRSASSVRVSTVTYPGAPSTVVCTGSPTIAPDAEHTYICEKVGGDGTYTLRMSYSGGSISGQVYCPE